MSETAHTRTHIHFTQRARSEKMAGHTSPEHYTTKAMHPLLRDAAAEEER